jgi:predicted kinase
MSTIVLLFGEMGTGKSFLGERIAEGRGYRFLEGDRYLPDDMREAVRNWRPVTPQMVDLLVTNLYRNVAYRARCDAALEAGYVGAVVTQALYRDEHRRYLIAAWKRLKFEVEPIWVRPPLRQQVRQLWSRRAGARWVAYALASKPWFQRPTHPHTVHRNPPA